MATQVPYNPTSQVAPEAQTTSFMRVDVPAAAFGANVGEAIKGLGKETQGAGTEIFERAIAMENLNQQAEANKRAADMYEQLGVAYARYSSLQGQAAVQGYKPFQEEIRQIREAHREGLSPYAQRAYDNDTRTQVSRTLFTAAGHAGRENKNYIISASANRVVSNNNYAQANPDDDQTYEESLKKNAEEVRQQGALTGQPPEKIQNDIAATNSQLTLSRIQAKAAQDPVIGKKWLDDAIKKGRLVGDDIAKATNFVQMKMNQIQSRRIGREATEGTNLYYGNQIVSNERALEATAGEGNEAPKFNVTTTEGNQTFLGKYRVSESNLPALLKAANMPSMDKDKFLADPKAQDQAVAARLAQLQKEHGSFNAALVAFRKENGQEGDPQAEVQRANRILATKATRAEKDEAARAIAKQTDPTNPELPDLASQQTALAASRREAIERNERLQQQNVLLTRLNERRQDGEFITSLEELTATPEAKAAWDKLTPQQRSVYLKQLEQNARGDYPYTEENQLTFNRYQGMATDPRLSPEDRDELLNTDIAALKLPAAQRQQLQTLQQKLLKNAVADPNMGAARRAIDPMLKNISGLDPNKDKENYRLFIGSYQQIIKDQMEYLKRPLKPEEFRQIASQLLQERHYRNFIGWGTSDKSFLVRPTDANLPKGLGLPRVEAVTSKFVKQYGRRPENAELTMIYNRMIAQKQFEQLYANKPKSANRVEAPSVTSQPPQPTAADFPLP